MTRAVLLLAVVVMAACTSVVPETTDASSTAPSDSGTENDQLSGRLPDGREYELGLDVELGDQQPFYVDATIEINMEQAPLTGDEIECPACTQPVLGITTFDQGSDQEPSYNDGVYRASSGDWTMDIAIYPDIASAWGADIEQALLGHIRPVDVGAGLPAFQLSGAFRWTEDVDVPAFMEVAYPAFVVRRGCDETSVACTATGSVQVIPLDPEMWESEWTVLISDAE